MAIKLNKKKNIFAKDLFTRKYKPKIVKPKKVKEVLKRKKVKFKVLHQFAELPLMTFPYLFQDILLLIIY